MRSLMTLGLVAMTACSFSAPSIPAADAPPAVAEVRFVSVTSNVAALRPGRYGIEVEAVLRNDLTVEITGIRPSLTIIEGTTSRASDFRWRDADARDGVPAAQPASIPPGGQATFRFRVDALAHAAGPGPILLGGEATFQAGGVAGSATPLDPPTSLPFEALPAPIVVTTTTDEDNGNGDTSLREALQQANANPGFDRVVFDSTVFAPGTPKVTLAAFQDKFIES